MDGRNDNMDGMEYPVDGVLDLHQFRPGDVKELVPDYLELCHRRGIAQVRIIHGKGTGTLRRTVHAILDRLETVDHYQLASDMKSSWGATIVTLKPEWD